MKRILYQCIIFLIYNIIISWAEDLKISKLGIKQNPRDNNEVIIEDINPDINSLDNNDLIFKSENIPIKFWNITEKNELKQKINDEDVVSISSSSTFIDFYNQLSNTEKQFYDAIYEHSAKDVPDLTISVEVTIRNRNAFIEQLKDFSERIFTALAYDKPELWWIGTYQISMSSTMKINHYYVIFDITPEDSIFSGYTGAKIKKLNDLIKMAKNDIMDQIADMKLTTNYAILRYIHDYLITKIIYTLDESMIHIRTIYGALVENKCVCEGYAEAFQYIAKQYGINCIIARSSEHEWNFVEMDGKWYVVDVTYDDPIINNKVTPQGYNDNLRTDYFLIGTDHKVDYYNKYSNDPDHVLVYSGYSDNIMVYYPDIETKDYAPSDLEIEELGLIDLTNITNTEYHEMEDGLHYNSTETSNGLSIKISCISILSHLLLIAITLTIFI